MGADSVDLEALAQKLTGRKFGELILHHVKKQTAEQVAITNLATIQELPVPDSVIEAWVDEVNPLGYLESFWSQDCGRAFRAITKEAAEFTQRHGVPFLSDDHLFSMFQVAVLNFAFMAHQQPPFRKYVQKCCGIGFIGRLFS